MSSSSPQGRRHHLKFADSASDHGVWNLRDDKTLFPAFAFNLHFSTQLDLPASGLVDLQQVVLIDHDAARREIGISDIHQLPGADGIVLHVCFYRVDDFPRLWVGMLCRHTDCDSFRSIDKKIRETDRKNFRLFFSVSKFRTKLTMSLSRSARNASGHLRKSCLGVTHSRSPVPFDGTEVSRGVHHHHAL